MSKWFGFLVSALFIGFSLMEVYLMANSTDMGEKTFHRVGFFGWIILANIELLSLGQKDNKST